MQKDMLLILKDNRAIVFIADEKTKFKKAAKLAKKFDSEVLEILTPPLRQEPKEKVCGFLQVNKCRVTKITCPFSNRIMSQCKSFTEAE